MPRSCFFCLILLFLLGCRGDTLQRNARYSFPTSSTPPDSILYAAQKLKTEAANGTAEDKAMASIFMGLYYGRISAFRQSRIAFNEALALIKNKPDSLLAGKIYTGLGNAAKNLAEYPEALVLFSKAISYYPSDSLAMANLHANIGQIFQMQDDLAQATVHLQYALQLSGNHKDNISYLHTLHTMANVYGMNNRTDSALLLDQEGIATTRRLKERAAESTFLDNMANCYLYSGHADTARYYFMQSLAIDSSLGNQKQMADTWLNMGALEQMQGNTAKAEPALIHGIALADACGYRNGAMAGWASLAELYEKGHQYERALKAKSLYYAIKDSVLNLKKETAIAEWKAVYETEKKEKEIRLQALQLRQKNISIWVVSISSILLLSTVYFANRRNKERKEKRYQESLLARDQEASMKILIAEENERKRIAADLHDGVGQTLTAAWLNLQAVHPLLTALDESNARLLRTTTQLVGDSCAEIRQISHNMMPEILFQKGLLPALQELISRINERRLFTSLSADESEVNPDKTTALILYRIVQECVNNVVRHSGATELYISINKEADHLAVMIEDNGIGFDQNEPGNQEGIGLQNIRSRVQYLRGSVEWNPVNDDRSGTVVAIYIPILHEQLVP